jgi:hypothetical protein
MTSRIVLSFVGALLVASCGHYPHFRVPDATRPQVVLEPGGLLVVNQEPLVVTIKAGEPATVTWRLAPGSGLTFTKDGIVILGRVKDAGQKPLPERDTSQNRFFACGPGEAPAAGTAQRDKDAAPNPLAFRCTIQPEAAKGYYSYVINTADRSGTRVYLDPTIMIR